ncbi:hypothetical protein FO519_009582 [Halicephalobus sp. NKZ332]|nr:hypothetical protein FO519_009582 [Halicephalobus sp. NKZ332]
MSETKFCADMSSVAEVYHLIIDVTTRYNMTGKISLPHIVVVGTESTGKTSLINRIVNKDFLPSGTGIVTRMPIKIGLIRTPLDDPRRRESKVEHDDWAEIDQDPKIYTDFNEVSNRLRNIMNQQAGTGVTNKPIVIRIYSESALNLSMIDLPGLVTNKIAGQPEDIPKQIEDMVTEYIRDPNTIILCVLPANVPESNWKAYQVVHDIDPFGERTIAALTKIDEIGEGDSADEKLLGKNINFKLGIVGICNRSQRQLDEGQTIDETARLEQDYFRKKYPKFVSTCGIKYLIKRMNELLVNKIKADWPRVMTTLQKNLKEIESQLLDLGVQQDIRSEDLSEKLFQIISDFSKEYEKLIYGGRAVLDNDEKAPCTKIYDIFHTEFEHKLQMNHTQNLERDRVRGWINNATGLTPKILLSSAPFTEACEIETQRYCSPSVECARRVYTELLNGINTCTRNIKPVFEIYPRIKERFYQIISKILSDYLQESEDLIKVYIESLASHISSAHPLFANAVDTENKMIRDGRAVRPDNSETHSDKCSTNQPQQPEKTAGWGFNYKKKPSISQKFEPNVVNEFLSHDQLNQTTNGINGNEDNKVANDAENNLFYHAEQQRNEQLELTLDEATYLIMLIISSMNRKLQKKLSPTLNLHLGRLNEAELEELFRENEIIATRRQQLENQRKVSFSLLDMMNF